MTFRLRGADDIDTSSGTTVTVDEPHAVPCRRCLHDVEPGEQAVLVSYDPSRVDSPYRGASPVFVHARPCPTYDGTTVPDQQRSRLLSVRGYDERAMLQAAEVTDGLALEAALERVFVDPAVAFVHVHNAKPGCFAVRVDRS